MSDRLADEVRAAVAAREELGQDYADAFLDARPRLTPSRAAVHIVVALGSIGLGVVFALVARDLGSLGGTVATIVAWAAILAINVVHARAGR